MNSGGGTGLTGIRSKEAEAGRADQHDGRGDDRGIELLLFRQRHGARAALSYRLPRLHLAENDLRRPPLAGERPHLTPSIPPEVSRRSPVGVLPDIRIGRAVAQLHDNAR
jgi:hypothetical protein